MLAAATVLPAVLGNTAEITTSNVRKGAAFDNIKAAWSKGLSIGDLKTTLKCNYDYNDNRDFLKEVSLSGDLMEGGDDDLAVSYEATHNFKSKATSVKVSAVTSGTTVSADYDTENQLTEVSAQRSVDVGDQKVDVSPSWLVQAKTARVKLMSKLGDKGSVSAQVDYGTEDSATSYEVGYTHDLDDGREVTATFKPDDNNLEVEYVDTTFEKDATWTAAASVPTDDASNILDAAKVTLKRSWSW